MYFFHSPLFSEVKKLAWIRERSKRVRKRNNEGEENKNACSLKEVDRVESRGKFTGAELGTRR